MFSYFIAKHRGSADSHRCGSVGVERGGGGAGGGGARPNWRDVAASGCAERKKYLPEGSGGGGAIWVRYNNVLHLSYFKFIFIILFCTSYIINQLFL